MKKTYQRPETETFEAGLIQVIAATVNDIQGKSGGVTIFNYGGGGTGPARDGGSALWDDEEDDSESIGQLFSDDYYANDAELFEESRAIEIKEALKNMFCERDQEIMKHYYGLFGYEPKTLTQLSEMFGLSDERVRQIVRTCTRQLRKAEALSDYQCA